MTEKAPNMDFKSRLETIINRQRHSYIADGFPSAAIRIDRLSRAIALLVENRDAVAAALSEDFGHRSTIQTIIADVFAAVGSLRLASAQVERWMQPEFYESLAHDAEARVEYHPLGVVGIIGPWNFPYNLVFSPLAGILAAGNRAVVKPSEFTPKSSALMGDLIARYFAPEEVAVIEGGPEEGETFSGAKWDHLIFTGSTTVGRHVMRAAAANLTPVTLELGGKSPVILTDQFDMAEAAARVMTVKTYNAGQICLAPDHVYVPRGTERAFVDACVAATRTMYPDGTLSDDYTAIISERHFARLQHIVEDARQKGAEVVEVLATAPEANDRRMTPTILVGVNDDMMVMQEEIFGPVLPVIGYDSLDAVIAKIRSGPSPLALYYFGEDDATAREVVDGTASGGVTINDVMAHVFVEGLPFGGVGPSGMGAYHGNVGFRTFSHARSIYRQSKATEAVMLMRAPYGEQTRQFLEEALLKGH
ncbi:Coniferyl aldehyde dehydrogenase [Sphingopyxis fribergensis]|uniref:Aldehyde dehydrogenase n=1 Tax=Sphingopyxis fribergensis TaxID=1515612 RepID=A0A0A7PB23_9SPHN|nr:coniferyl aldehyde dehydrogenase [Sphingopyxis fribergensis]AJA07134.1 Coniferyl aldehyde dehydrogenase [Sphingopyxis fribergensis]